MKLTSRSFKTFDNVRRWMEEQGWSVSYEEQSWKSYIDYVFEVHLSINSNVLAPYPAQLKNKILLKRFLNRPSEAPPPKVVELRALRELYSRTVVEEDELEVLLKALDDTEKRITQNARTR